MRDENWTHGPSSVWTDEQTENAATYGVCMTCGAPREVQTVPVTAPLIGVWDDGRREAVNADEVWKMEIACPNGHPQ